MVSARLLLAARNLHCAKLAAGGLAFAAVRNAFFKGHGLGNDYLVMEAEAIDFPFAPAAIRRICHRSWGVGSDGILLRVPSAVADAGLRIFNPDGSEAEKSGNGLRIFAKYRATLLISRVTNKSTTRTKAIVS